MKMSTVAIKGEGASWEILANSRLPNWAVNRESTDLQVVTIFFFRVVSVILHMEVDCLLNLHDAPPVCVGKSKNGLNLMIHPGADLKSRKGG